MILEINTELIALKDAVINDLVNHNLNIRLSKYDRSFNQFNWIITLPFNYAFLKPGIDKNSIRELALANALYAFYFLAEDKVLDEYHLPTKIFNTILTKYCAAQSLRTLAIGKLLRIADKAILDYICRYEGYYYSSIIMEKSCLANSEQVHRYVSNPRILGDRAIPAMIPFAAFAIVYKCMDNLTACEQLIRSYHIAHQIHDDITDLDQDVHRPDRSWLIRYVEHKSGYSKIRKKYLKEYLNENLTELEIPDLFYSNLLQARKCAEQLHFKFFLKNIDLLSVSFTKTCQSMNC